MRGRNLVLWETLATQKNPPESLILPFLLLLPCSGSSSICSTMELKNGLDDSRKHVANWSLYLVQGVGNRHRTVENPHSKLQALGLILCVFYSISPVELNRTALRNEDG